MEFPSREWAEEFCSALNKSKGYRNSSRGWVWPILFVVTDLPGELASRFPSGRPGFRLDLDNGVCKGVEWYDDASEASAPFVIEAKFSDWEDIIAGKTNPIVALIRRKLVLKKGDFSAVLRYPSAALEMVKAAQSVAPGD